VYFVRIVIWKFGNRKFGKKNVYALFAVSM